MVPEISHCPGTLKKGYNSYSNTALRRLFNGRKVNHVLPYHAPYSNSGSDSQFVNNQKHLSISGVQEKFSVVLDKNQLRLAREGELSSYILKSIPGAGKRPDQMPANEHLTMQLARQVFGIETAENALIFFQDGKPAYLTKRFDRAADGAKWGQEDFAALTNRSPQTHGEHYKYEGNYLELFETMRKMVPAYTVEAPKLFKLILFNYLVGNGDAHFKNFSLIETPLGDYKLSPAYDLLNSRIHIEDKEFALHEGLLPKRLAKGKVHEQFEVLAKEALISDRQCDAIMEEFIALEKKVVLLVEASYLDLKTKRTYRQLFQTRLKKLLRK